MYHIQIPKSCGRFLFMPTGYAAPTITVTTTTSITTSATTTTATTTQAETTTQYKNVTSNILFSKAHDPVIEGSSDVNSETVYGPAMIACLVVISLLTVIIAVLAEIITLMRLQTSATIIKPRKNATIVTTLIRIM